MAMQVGAERKPFFVGIPELQSRHLLLGRHVQALLVKEVPLPSTHLDRSISPIARHAVANKTRILEQDPQRDEGAHTADVDVRSVVQHRNLGSNTFKILLTASDFRASDLRQPSHNLPHGAANL